VKTFSLRTFINKLNYYYQGLSEEEENKFISLFNCTLVERNEYLEYEKLGDYIEDLSTGLKVWYRNLLRAEEYNVKNDSKNANYLTLSSQQRKSYNFPHIDYWLDDMIDFIYLCIEDYFWVKHKVKCQAVEGIIKILQAGGMPCGYKVIKPHEDILQQEVEFLVFWPHKDNA
jgi:hypothetical protein